MRQKLIVQAVAMALALPIGAAWAAPTARVKPDSMLAVDMNRSAIIKRKHRQPTGNRASALVQESVLRDTLSNSGADHLLAGFDGAVIQRTPRGHEQLPTKRQTSGRRSMKRQLPPTSTYNPITPCRIVDTRVVGDAV